MKIFKVFIDIDKEEKWLNQMYKKGYTLVSKSFRYKFEKTNDKDLMIRVDFRIFKNTKDFTDYKLLFEDSGWKHLVGQKNSGNQYFEKTRHQSDDDIFSDELSKVAKIKRYTMFWGIYTLLLFILLNGRNRLIFNPKDLFLTPGLWDRVGPEFWHAFWIEIPAVLVRAFYSYGIFILVMGYLYVTYASAKKILKHKL